ncbi:hypothetical protein SAMN05661096_02973 [Marivirga sericea]|uniref:Uncharacterized protein n=1 Tax=Marivirga sericea TaxID=1028 RepID=A0A1X7KNI8_9BACT|nr:hypothetical protein [Marivirga sericea]SMG43069.1 hypothetical protein SAMN05661096_02973 [Marivirga sericea]
MDRYRINFVCNKLPDQKTGLMGFKIGENYEGRAFNGLFEINAKWGSGTESKLISKSLFDEYFELLQQDQYFQTSA